MNCHIKEGEDITSLEKGSVVTEVKIEICALSDGTQRMQHWVVEEGGYNFDRKISKFKRYKAQPGACLLQVLLPGGSYL